MKAVQQPRALATREKILKAAARLFALKGYHDTKLEEVRHAAEVTTGAFFHHFGGKEDLGFAVLDRHMERRRQELEQIEREMLPPRDDAPLERVYRRLDAIAELVRRREHRKAAASLAISARRWPTRTRRSGSGWRTASTRWPASFYRTWRPPPGKGVPRARSTLGRWLVTW